MALNLNISIINHVSLKEKVFLARQLAVMLSAGLAIDHSFKVLQHQTKNTYLQQVYATILKDLEQGNSLSSALGKHGKVFDPVFIAIVRSGESSGQLDKVLVQLADRMEMTQDFNSKVKAALIYPIFIILVMVGIIVAMMIFVIPNLKSVFEQSNIALPWTTLTIVAISDFTVQFWWVELVTAIILGFCGWIFFRSENGGSLWDMMKINMPIIRELYVEIYMARFCQTMSMLVKSGVPIIETLAITANVIQNRIYTRTLKMVASQVERGIPMSVPLRADPNFPQLISEMIMVGEQTGKMETILDKMGEFYERETNSMIKGMAGLIEPVIILVIGLAVGFLVYSIIVPIYSVAQTGF